MLNVSYVDFDYEKDIGTKRSMTIYTLLLVVVVLIVRKICRIQLHCLRYRQSMWL